jgi:type IV pilus assembly protein PilM
VQLARNESTTGVDLGSHSVKLARVRRAGGGLSLTHLAVEPVPAGGSEAAPERAYSGAVRSLFRRSGLRAAQVGRLVVSTSGEKINLRQVEMPGLSDAELASAAPHEARKHLPVDGETETDAQVLARGLPNDRMHVLLVAAPRTLRDRAVRILNEADLRPVAVDVSHLAVMNALLGENPSAGEGEKGVALLDLGASASLLNLYKRGSLFYSRNLSFSGSLLAGRIAEALGVDGVAAHRLLEEMPGRQGEDRRMIQALEREVAALADEVRDAFSYFHARSGKAGVGIVYLSGGPARNPRIREALSRELPVPVETLTPPCGLSVDPGLSGEGRDALVRFGPQLSVVLGLVRGWSA